MRLASDLADGLTALGIAMPAKAQAAQLRYLALIEKWNKVHNLTAIRDPEQMLAHHLLDSLAVLSHLGGAKSLVDVGSGAGLPGIPLAIAKPELAVTLVDSSHKRQSFQQQCRAELGLSNVTPIHSRIEDFQASAGFDVVISRAFSELSDFVILARHLCAKGGRLFAMKGLHPYEEIAKLPHWARVIAVKPLIVPRLNAARHLLEIEIA
jgi:16S rRNA (guanine527-N7)-methyltransferase